MEIEMDGSDVQNEVALLHIISSYQDKCKLEEKSFDQICGFLYNPLKDQQQQLFCNYCHFECGLDQVLLFLEHLNQHIFHCQYCSFQTFCHSRVQLHVHQSHNEFSNYESISLCTFFDLAKKDFGNKELKDQETQTDRNTNNFKDEGLTFSFNVSDAGSLIERNIHIVKKEPTDYLGEDTAEGFNHENESIGTITNMLDGHTSQLIKDNISDVDLTSVSPIIKAENMNETTTSGLSYVATSESSYPNYKCLICDKYFYTMQALCSHKRLHTKNKEFVCFICGFRCDSQVRLQNHSKTHGDRFVCDVCGKKFAKRCLLSKHKKIKHDIIEVIERPVSVCTFCGHKFNNRQELALHLKKEHKVFECKSCDLKFTSKETFLEHKKTHMRKPYKCDICNKEVPRSQIKHHRQTEHSGQPYKCGDCGRTYSIKQKQKYDLHLIQHKHGGRRPYMCEICGKRFTLPRTLQLHIRNGHEHLEKKYICTICGRQCKHKMGLSLHMKIHYYKHHCKMCGKGFKSEEDLHRHENLHLETGQQIKIRKYPDPLMCDICGKKVKYMSVHKFRVHSAKKQVHRCHVCGFRYRFKNSLMKHIKLKHGDNISETDSTTDGTFMSNGGSAIVDPVNFPSETTQNEDDDVELQESFMEEKKLYKCKYCGRVFKFENCLMNHCREKHKDKKFVYWKDQRKKTKAKPDRAFKPKYEPTVTRSRAKKVMNGKAVECPLCDKKFSSLYGLFAHKKSHEQDRNYKCGICGKCYVTEKNLADHKLIHTQKKMYQCMFCDKKFVKKVLRKHYTNVHKITANIEINEDTHEWMFYEDECLKCGEKFTNKRALQKHLTDKHPDSVETPSRILDSIPLDMGTWYQCEHCGCQYKTQINLEKHRRNKHPREVPGLRMELQ